MREAAPRALLPYMHGVEVKRTTALLPFREPLVRAAIHEAKFHCNTKAIDMLAAVLTEYFERLPREEHVLIPIPLSKPRLRERGHNQVASVAKRACSELSHVHLEEKVLARTRHTKPQTELKKEEREQNVADAFGVRDPSLLENADIILLDDVITTGATMRAVAKVLKAHRPKSVRLVALAH